MANEVVSPPASNASFLFFSFRIPLFFLFLYFLFLSFFLVSLGYYIVIDIVVLPLIITLLPPPVWLRFAEVFAQVLWMRLVWLVFGRSSRRQYDLPLIWYQ